MRTRRSFLAAALGTAAGAQTKGFRWPQGKRVALSLSFDDARASQIDTGLALLENCGVKATFYVQPSRMTPRLMGWKRAVMAGHEIGHHTDSHPCTANYRFSRTNALEDYTEARMEAEFDRTTREIERLLGVRPRSFAYPCGQKFIGRGEGTRSYVPLVAKRFLTGRGYLDEAANDPEVCDLASLMGTGLDELTFEQMRKHVESAAKENRWVIFAGHDIGSAGRQVTNAAAIEQLSRYAADAANGVWLDTVGVIGEYVKRQRA